MHIYLYVYMLAIAGKTAGPNWLNCFREPTGTCGPWVTQAKRI